MFWKIEKKFFRTWKNFYEFYFNFAQILLKFSSNYFNVLTNLTTFLFQVETVKRLCVKKLPPVLTIQLKRFEYDFERVCAIKFNDYFEFPRNLDMEPYTGMCDYRVSRTLICKTLKLEHN